MGPMRRGPTVHTFIHSQHMFIHKLEVFDEIDRVLVEAQSISLYMCGRSVFVVNKYDQRKQSKKVMIEPSLNLERGRERRISTLAKASLESQDKNESNGLVYKNCHTRV